jgi:hypothetical protein
MAADPGPTGAMSKASMVIDHIRQEVEQSALGIAQVALDRADLA